MVQEVSGASASQTAALVNEAGEPSSPSGLRSTGGMPAKAVAFTDKDGNRFIFPSWIIRRDDPDAPLATDHWWEANAICARSELTQEWIEFDPDCFPHVQSELGSNMFLHGRASTYLFAGPVFDGVKSELEQSS